MNETVVEGRIVFLSSKGFKNVNILDPYNYTAYQDKEEILQDSIFKVC